MLSNLMPIVRICSSNFVMIRMQTMSHTYFTHTEVRWLSKGNRLKGFMELSHVISDFLSDKPQMKHLLTADGKAFVSF